MSSHDSSGYYDYSERYEDIENENPAHYKVGGYHYVNPNELYNGKYRIESKVGWGSFSTVWMATDITKSIDHKNRLVAIKFVKSLKKYTESAKVELKFLEKMRRKNRTSDENVVMLLDHFMHRGANGNHLCMVFEVLGDNFLQLIIKKEKKLKAENESIKGPLIEIGKIKQYAKDALKGLDFLHSKCGLIHTDIKPENIVLSLEEAEKQKRVLEVEHAHLERKSEVDNEVMSMFEKLTEQNQKAYGEQNGEAKRPRSVIVDMGNAIKTSKANNSEISTRQYRPPEVILGQIFTTSVDIWGLACTIFELATGELLFDPQEITGLSENSKDTDHLALMVELIGEFPLEVCSKGETCNKFFADGKLKSITDYQFWHLKDILTEKYFFENSEAEEMSNFLMPMLALDKNQRVSAKEALRHPWLEGVE